jgi:putative glycosyltransferase (TIGR04348 family)
LHPRILIVSPALAADNTGNWQTARRWAHFLREGHRVEVARDWDGSPVDAMIALHARRSAGALARFAAAGGPVALVLTGTDLYRDIRTDADARRSLELARRLVVLQERGRDELPPALWPKTETIFQSAPALRPGRPRTRTFDLLLVGHLRPEKDPMTALRALRRLSPDAPPSDRLRLLHAGSDRDPVVGEAFRREAAADPRVRLLGPLPRARARQLIRRGRVLLLPSLIEGGANVLIEAVTAGVPVLGSRIPGSVGMLGADYEGWCEPGDDAGLAALIARCQREPAFLERLRAQCARRAPLFDPAAERAAVRRLTHNLLDPQTQTGAAAPAGSSEPRTP